MKFKLLGILSLTLLLLNNCSIFDGLYPDETAEGDVETLIAKGDTELSKGNPYEAWINYDKAVQKAPRNSKARWGAAKSYILYKNADLILIASKIMGKQDPSTIISKGASSLVDTMSKVIFYLDPIAKGQCDEQISRYSVDINLNLMLAYLIRGFLKNGDKPNSDGNYFSNGDLFILQNGKLSYNTNVVKIEDYQKTLESSYEDIVNSLSQTPPSSIPRSSVSNIIYIAHNITEDLLLIYYIMGSSFNDFSGGMFALNNATVSISGSEVVEELKKELQDRYNEFNGYLNGADIDTANLNNDHFRFVGTNMIGYSGSPNWYDSFTNSDWSTHSNPPNTEYQPGKTNLYWRFLNRVSGNLLDEFPPDAQFTNELIFITDLTNCLSKLFRDIENANLLKNLGVR